MINMVVFKQVFNYCVDRQLRFNTYASDQDNVYSLEIYIDYHTVDVLIESEHVKVCNIKLDGEELILYYNDPGLFKKIENAII